MNWIGMSNEELQFFRQILQSYIAPVQPSTNPVMRICLSDGTTNTATLGLSPMQPEMLKNSENCLPLLNLTINILFGPEVNKTA